MSAPNLYAFGAGPDPWSSWAHAVLGRATAAEPPPAGAVPAEDWLAIVEHPAQLLAAALTHGDLADPAAWLQEWRLAARRLLRLVQRDPARTLLLDAAELRLETQAFRSVCGERFGLDVGASLPPAPGACSDALALALAEAFCTGDAEAQSLVEELQASCAPLGTDLPPRPLLDGVEACRRLAEMREAAAAALTWSARCAAAEARVAALAQEQAQWAVERGSRDVAMQALRTQVSRAEQARDAALAEQDRQAEELRAAARSLDEARSESRLLGLQLQQLREEFDQGHPALEELAQVRERLDVQTRLGSVLQGKLVQQTRQLETATLEGAQWSVELRAARAALGSAQEALRAMESERVQWTTRLAETQRQLQALDQRAAAAEAAAAEAQRALSAQPPPSAAAPPAAAVPTGPWPGDGSAVLTVGQAAILAEHNEPPYRGLTLSLRDLGFGERRVSSVKLRLVEHLGRPGIVLFLGPPSHRLLSRWHQTGRELDEDYTLFMPTDLNYGPSLDVLGATDWLLLHALIEHVGEELRRRPAVNPMWVHLARRLGEQLRDVPPRLHYDTLDVVPTVGTRGLSLSLRFGRVLCASRRLPRLEVQWQLDGASVSIELANDPETGPPLMDWPIDAQGRLVDRMLLPLDPALDDEARRKGWLALESQDRMFTFGLLASWPDVVAKLPEDALAAARLSRDALTAASAQLLQDAQRAAQLPVSPARGLLRRVVRRLG